MVEYLEISEKFISKNKTILLLLFNICLLIILYLKYHNYNLSEYNI